jgi:hypothetical protein
MAIAEEITRLAANSAAPLAGGFEKLPDKSNLP